jgi:protocatechuate 3,4-dioxygenase beta subunit
MRKGKGWTRRDFVAASFTIATALRLQQSARALGFSRDATICRLAPGQETGPFYIAGEMLRSDITERKPGVPLELRLTVLDSRSCQPLRDAAIEIWHCDALGIYSGFADNPMNGPGGPPPGAPPPDGPPPNGDPQNPGDFPPGPPQNHPTNKLTFLRGIQVTNADGIAAFRTIVPGYYMGRTNHIHFKVRIGGHPDGNTYAAGHISHTGQVFFPEEICAELMHNGPYAGHSIHRTTQDEDFVFNQQGGASSIAKVRSLNGKDYSEGMRAEIIAAIDPTAVSPLGIRPRGGPSRPRPNTPTS